MRPAGADHVTTKSGRQFQWVRGIGTKAEFFGLVSAIGPDPSDPAAFLMALPNLAVDVRDEEPNLIRGRAPFAPFARAVAPRWLDQSVPKDLSYLDAVNVDVQVLFAVDGTVSKVVADVDLGPATRERARKQQSSGRQPTEAVDSIEQTIHVEATFSAVGSPVDLAEPEPSNIAKSEDLAS